MSLKTRIVAGAAFAVAAGGLLFGSPAGAVQTTSWGITAAPTQSGGRAVLAHPADGTTVHDSVVVYNRTAQPLVVNLSVVDATFSNDTYRFGTDKAGLAGGVSLAATRITLGPNQQAQVPVTVKEPRGSSATALAGIAAESAPVEAGSLSVMQRLVVLIKATPDAHPVASAPSSGIGPAGPVAAALFAGAAGLAGWEIRKSRRRALTRGPRLVGAGAGT